MGWNQQLVKHLLLGKWMTQWRHLKEQLHMQLQVRWRHLGRGGGSKLKMSTSCGGSGIYLVPQTLCLGFCIASGIYTHHKYLGPQWSLFLEGQPPKTSSFPTKARGHLGSIGIYIYINTALRIYCSHDTQSRTGPTNLRHNARMVVALRCCASSVASWTWKYWRFILIPVRHVVRLLGTLAGIWIIWFIGKKNKRTHTYICCTKNTSFANQHLTWLMRLQLEPCL